MAMFPQELLPFSYIFQYSNDTEYRSQIKRPEYWRNYDVWFMHYNIKNKCEEMKADEFLQCCPCLSPGCVLPVCCSRGNVRHRLFWTNQRWNIPLSGPSIWGTIWCSRRALLGNPVRCLALQPEQWREDLQQGRYTCPTDWLTVPCFHPTMSWPWVSLFLHLGV